MEKLRPPGIAESLQKEMLHKQNADVDVNKSMLSPRLTKGRQRRKNVR